jgi:NADPH-dependent 2,4-dienoyl-CoA reductase/sulfur reductase-like enzyme
VTLREEGWRGRILLLGAEPDVPFGRPPLSKTYLRGQEDLSASLVRPADWYSAHNVEFRTGVTAAQVDTAQQQVGLTSGETVDSQQLALCMGSRNRRFAVAGATLPGVYQLRPVAECDAIRQAARPGAGPLGWHGVHRRQGRHLAAPARPRGNRGAHWSDAAGRRGLATRYEKRAVNERAMLVLASIVLWLES